MRDPRLVVRGCGVTTFWGIKDATVDYISIDLRDNCIKSFVHFGTHPKLVELRLGNNKIDCFMGLTRQPSLTVIDLEGNPIASHPLCRIMVLLVVGFSVTEINGIPVSDEEYRRARYFGYSAALAVSHGWNLQPEVRTPNEYRLIVEECRKSWRGAHAPEGATITLAHVLKRGEQTEWTKLSLENKARGAGIVPLNSEDIDQMLLHARKLEELLSDVKRRQADKLWCLREGIETEAVGGMTASELCCAESLLFTNGIRWRTNVNSDCDSDGFCRGALLFEGLLLVFLTFMSRARVAEFALSDIRVEYHSNFLRICGKGGAMFDVMFGSSQVLVSVYKLIYLRQGLTAPLLALNDNIEGTIKLLTNVADKGARMSQGQPVVDANMQASYQGRGNMGPPPNPAGMPLGLTFTGEGDLDASKTVDKTAHELKCTANGIHNNCIPSAVMGGFAESQQSIVMDDTCQNSSTWTQVTLPVDCTVDDTTLLCHSVQSHRNEKKNAPSFCMPCYHTNADRSPPTAPTMMLSGDEDAVSARSANPSTVRKRSARSSSVSKRDHQEAPGTALATSKLSGGEDAVSTRSTNPSTVRKRSARSSSVSKRDHQEAPGTALGTSKLSGGEDAVSTRSANPSTMRKRSARSSLVSKRDQQEAPGTALGTSKLSGGEDAVSTRSANPSTMRKRSARSSLVSKRDQQEAPGTALGTSKLSGGEDAVSTRSANPSTMRKRSARSSLVSKRDQQEAPGTALGTSKLSGGEDAVSTRSANPSTMRKRSARSSSVSKRDQQEAPGTALGTSKLSGDEDAVSTRSANPSTMRKRSARSSSVSKRDQQEAPGTALATSKLSGDEDAVSARSANPSTVRKRSARSSSVSKRDQQEAPGTALGTSKLSGGEDAVSTRSANPSTVRKRSARLPPTHGPSCRSDDGVPTAPSLLTPSEDAGCMDSRNLSPTLKQHVENNLPSSCNSDRCHAVGVSVVAVPTEAPPTSEGGASRGASPSSIQQRITCSSVTHQPARQGSADYTPATTTNEATSLSSHTNNSENVGIQSDTCEDEYQLPSLNCSHPSSVTSLHFVIPKLLVCDSNDPNFSENGMDAAALERLPPPIDLKRFLIALESDTSSD